MHAPLRCPSPGHPRRSKQQRRMHIRQSNSENTSYSDKLSAYFLTLYLSLTAFRFTRMCDSLTEHRLIMRARKVKIRCNKAQFGVRSAWADRDRVRQKCERLSYPCRKIPNVIDTDLAYLATAGTAPPLPGDPPPVSRHIIWLQLRPIQWLEHRRDVATTECC